MTLDMILEDMTKTDSSEMALIKMDMMYLDLIKKDIRLMNEMLTENTIDYMTSRVIFKTDITERVF